MELMARLQAQAKRHVVQTPGGGVCWRGFGAGPALVLVHGGHGSWLHWVRNIEALSRSFTVWVPDLPGYGDSDDAATGGLSDLLDSTLTMLAPKLGDIEVRREYDRSLPPIPVYAAELNQVWTNILDNAIDAMGGHGRIRIRAFARDGDVVVEICDDGPGMPPEVRERIFEPFYTTKPPGSGTGLGLHISHNVVGRHGGRIEVRSHPGETCFEVVLPIGRRAG